MSSTNEVLMSPADMAELDHSYITEASTPSLDIGLERLLLAFLERAIRDYMELSPTGCRKSSEYSDGHMEADEWMSAARFLFEEERVMSPSNVTFEEVCDILDIDSDMILSRIRKEVGGKG